MSHMGGMWYKYWQSKSQRFFYFIVVVVIVCTRHKAHGCADCRIGLTNPSGYFTSPCYPSVYPNSQACEWKILAPPGFIIKLIFVDFELEEAQKCIYDYVVVYTGESSRTFCGLTANRLSFTSTGNTMNISFTSDFSVQKKGFNATYWHVAVLLRNQKVTLTKTSSESLASVKDSIPIPKLKQFTICLEAQRSSSNVNNWMLFSYADSSSMEYFSFGRNSGSYYVSILGTFCDINGILPLGLDGEIFGSTWQEFCISWDSTSGTVSTYIKGNLDTITCVQTVGKVIPANGILALGSQSASLDSFNGDIYNFRLWNFTISLEKPDMRQCEEKGNIVDWENDMWSIPTIALKEDYNLSCGTQLQQQTTTQPRDCSQLGVICQALQGFKVPRTLLFKMESGPHSVSPYKDHMHPRLRRLRSLGIISRPLIRPARHNTRNFTIDNKSSWTDKFKFEKAVSSNFSFASLLISSNSSGRPLFATVKSVKKAVDAGFNVTANQLDFENISEYVSNQVRDYISEQMFQPFLSFLSKNNKAPPLTLQTELSANLKVDVTDTFDSAAFETSLYNSENDKKVVKASERFWMSYFNGDGMLFTRAEVMHLVSHSEFNSDYSSRITAGGVLDLTSKDASSDFKDTFHQAGAVYKIPIINTFIRLHESFSKSTQTSNSHIKKGRQYTTWPISIPYSTLPYVSKSITENILPFIKHSEMGIFMEDINLDPHNYGSIRTVSTLFPYMMIKSRVLDSPSHQTEVHSWLVNENFNDFVTMSEKLSDLIFPWATKYHRVRINEPESLMTSVNAHINMHSYSNPYSSGGLKEMFIIPSNQLSTDEKDCIECDLDTEISYMTTKANSGKKDSDPLEVVTFHVDSQFAGISTMFLESSYQKTFNHDGPIRNPTVQELESFSYAQSVRHGEQVLLQKTIRNSLILLKPNDGQSKHIHAKASQHAFKEMDSTHFIQSFNSEMCSTISQVESEEILVPTSISSHLETETLISMILNSFAGHSERHSTTNDFKPYFLPLFSNVARSRELLSPMLTFKKLSVNVLSLQNNGDLMSNGANLLKEERHTLGDYKSVTPVIIEDLYKRGQSNSKNTFIEKMSLLHAEGRNEQPSYIPHAVLNKSTDFVHINSTSHQLSKIFLGNIWGFVQNTSNSKIKAEVSGDFSKLSGMSHSVYSSVASARTQIRQDDTLLQEKVTDASFSIDSSLQFSSLFYMNNIEKMMMIPEIKQDVEMFVHSTPPLLHSPEFIIEHTDDNSVETDMLYKPRRTTYIATDHSEKHEGSFLSIRPSYIMKQTQIIELVETSKCISLCSEKETTKEIFPDYSIMSYGTSADKRTHSLWYSADESVSFHLLNVDYKRGTDDSTSLETITVNLTGTNVSLLFQSSPTEFSGATGILQWNASKPDSSGIKVNTSVPNQFGVLPGIGHQMPSELNKTFSVPLESATQHTESSESVLLSLAPDNAASCQCNASIVLKCLCGTQIINRDLYYKIVIIINNQNPDAVSYVEHNVSLWLNQTFQNWNYSVYVKNVSAYLLSRDRSAKVRNRRDVSYARYFCHALLVYSPMNNITLNEDTIRKRIVRNNETIATGLQLESVMVDSIENCKPEEIPSHYSWISTRPNVTREIQCYLDSGQTASRKCVLNEQNYTSYWDTPQLENCENIKVTSDNAADVANQIFLDLADGQSLNSTQVEKFVLQLNQIVNIAEINTSLASTVVTVFSRILNNNDEALVTSSSLALKTVDELAQKIQFTGPSVSITSPNLALGILAMNTSSYNGSSFSTGQGTNGTSLQVNFGSHDTSSLASVVLPPSLLENLTELERDMLSRSQFSFFHKIGLFQDKHLKNQVNNTEKLISYVVASSIGNMSISGLHDPVQVTVKHAPNKNENGTPYCVFWDFQLYNGSGGWNKTGCRVSSSNTSETVCFCNHLTNFAILMDIQGSSQNIGSENEKALTFITYIGCGLSAICSATTVLTYIAFEKLRRDYPSKILMNLSTAIMFLNLVFLVDGWLASFKIGGLCIAVAALLHFFLLTSITWMGLEAVHMYIALVKVFNTYIRRYILKFCIVGWGLPLLIVVIVLAATNGSAYGQQPYGEDDKGARASEFCWILNRTVFYVTCVGYFCVVFLMNIAMFIVVMLQICGRNGKRCHQSATEEIMRNLRSSVSLTFLLGMTWGFAFFAWGPLTVPFFYLFTICNSLQGFFIFIFHCALKDNVQKQWRRYLCCGKLRLPENSDWSKTTTPKKPSSGSGSGSASDNLGKSLSSTSLASNSTNWTNKSKSSSTHFFKRNSNADNVFVDKTSTKSASIDKEQMTIIPVHQVIDKVKDYCSVRSDNFYKNIIMSDSFSHSTKF
ncbi:adhesion G-protein coupled receptor G6 isoform X2 [Protopterus annectens]|uniref:adhesion G-protein coupled receptor G6 isoform X2 n=1 Tax=Protopterus annectens TaxID=7888 RepID=UPI001CF9D7D1|nr:adhesion G-protein coupled receptor G6 isoform X2 [Protopterus annectens]